MEILFYSAAAVALFATFMTITRINAVHALLYLVVSLAAVALVFYSMGAAFVAALELIVYAGAIMVLFIFVVMLLNLGDRAAGMERGWLGPGVWTGPAILAAILIAETTWAVSRGAGQAAAVVVEPKQVALALYGPYVLGVELASMLLLGGLVGAFHLGRRQPARTETADVVRTRERRADTSRDTVRDGDGRVGRPQERDLPAHVD